MSSSLVSKARKTVPSAMPAAAAISFVVTAAPDSRRSGMVALDDGIASLLGRHGGGAGSHPDTISE